MFGKKYRIKSKEDKHEKERCIKRKIRHIRDKLLSNGNVKCNKTYEKLINIEIEKNEITNSAIALFLIIFNNIVFDI